MDHVGPSSGKSMHMGNGAFPDQGNWATPTGMHPSNMGMGMRSAPVHVELSGLQDLRVSGGGERDFSGPPNFRGQPMMMQSGPPPHQQQPLQQQPPPSQFLHQSHVPVMQDFFQGL